MVFNKQRRTNLQIRYAGTNGQTFMSENHALQPKNTFIKIYLAIIVPLRIKHNYFG